METITFSKFMAGDDGMIDLATVPPHMQMDYNRRNENILNGKELCKSCDGTGNEFMSMYRKCDACAGTGAD